MSRTLGDARDDSSLPSSTELEDLTVNLAAKTSSCHPRERVRSSTTTTTITANVQSARFSIDDAPPVQEEAAVSPRINRTLTLGSRSASLRATPPPRLSSREKIATSQTGLTKIGGIGGRRKNLLRSAIEIRESHVRKSNRISRRDG